MKCPRCGKENEAALSLVCTCGYDFRGPPMSSPGFYELFFSFDGRIPRSKWWLGALAVGAAFAIASLIFLRLLHSPLLYWLSAVPILWATIAIAVKRWHDINASGWWAIVNLIPGIGLIALVFNGLIKGTKGPNKYGPDPLAKGGNGHE